MNQQRQQRNTLRVRTLEILWHWKEEREEEIEVGLRNNVIDGVTSIDYNTHNNRILTTGGDLCIRMWQLHPDAIDTWLDNSAADMTACCTHLCVLKKDETPLTARWSPQGELFASGHCNGCIYLWHKKKTSIKTKATEEWEETKQLRGHLYDVYDVCFSPCSRFVLSGSWEGGVMVHSIDDLGAIVQLPQSHGKFCRGVAWDPWNRFFVSFGASPALQLYTIDIPLPKKANESKAHESTVTAATTTTIQNESENHLEKEQETEESLTSLEHHHKETHKEHARYHNRFKRLQVLKQEKCDGDYLGESCAMAFRRLAFSPDGLLLAVPFGKIPRTARSHSDGKGAQRTINSVINVESLHASHITATSKNDVRNDINTNSNINKASGNVKNNVEADDLSHCVNIYARNAFNKLLCRLAIRGYNEIRGVQWAPCFFAPVHVAESSEESAGDAHDKYTKADNHSVTAAPAALSSECHKTKHVKLYDNENNIIHVTQTNKSQEHRQSAQDTEESCPLHQHEEQQREELEESGTIKVNSNKNTEDIHVKGVKTAEKKEEKVSEYQRHVCGMWGPAEYRMALAVWTSDAVIVYTTDSTKRHSDYTDLHMRSIMDLAWSGDGAYLYTASLDGYVSVISFGDSLCPSSRLPVFAQTSPLCRIVRTILTRIDELSKVIEFKNCNQNDDNDNGKGNKSGKEGVTMVAVRKKKKKVDQFNETTTLTATNTTTETNSIVRPAVPKQAEVTEMELKQLEELMSDVETKMVS